MGAGAGASLARGYAERLVARWHWRRHPVLALGLPRQLARRLLLLPLQRLNAD